MQNDVVGVNEKGIDNLILEIYDYVEKIKGQLNQFEDLVDSTKNFYQSESGENFRNRFVELKDNFQVVNDNILSYSVELSRVKEKHYGISIDLSNELRQKSNKFENK